MYYDPIVSMDYDQKDNIYIILSSIIMSMDYYYYKNISKSTNIISNTINLKFK